MDHGMRVELMVSVLQTGAFSVSPSVEKLCKAGFLPANHTRVNGFRFCRYAIFVGGVRRPIRVPLLRFRSTGHDRQGPRAVVGSSEFPSDLSTPRRLTPARRIQGTSSKLLAQIKATEGFAPPYPIVPWTSPSTDSNRLSGLCKRTAPRGACISRLPCCKGIGAPRWIQTNNLIFTKDLHYRCAREALKLVETIGLEPTPLAGHAPQACVYCHFTTSPKWCRGRDLNPQSVKAQNFKFHMYASSTTPADSKDGARFCVFKAFWIAVWAPEKHAGLGIYAHWNRR